MYIKLFGKNEKNGNPKTGNENIQSGHRNGIWHIKMCHTNNEEWEMTDDRRNRTTKPRKDQNAQRKGNLQILGNIGSWHHQTIGDE